MELPALMGRGSKCMHVHLPNVEEAGMRVQSVEGLVEGG
jgi:hypothetical protein